MKWIWHYPDQAPYLDFFVNPLPAAAMLGMAVNDHWLKYADPGWLTGKLSDFLGMFYFPLFLCALSCLLFNVTLRWLLPPRRPAYINRPLMLSALALTAALMALVKLSPVACALIEAWFSRTFFEIRLTPDPTDLLSFVVLPLSYFYAARFFNARPASVAR